MYSRLSKNSIFLLLALLLSLQLFAQTKPDSTKAPFTVSGSILVSNNGIDPVPAFALGEPAVMSSIFIKKGNFLFNPQFNYSLKGKPWSVNNWLFNSFYSLRNNFKIFQFVRGNIFKPNAPTIMSIQKFMCTD